MNKKLILQVAVLSIFFLLSQVLLTACSDSTEVLPTDSSKKQIVSQLPFSPETEDWPHSTSDIPHDPRVSYGRLDNGLRYAILPVPDKEGVTSVQLNIDAGWNDEPENAYGVAHLLEHIAFRGKQNKTNISIIHDFQSAGVGFGYDLNGFTTGHNTYYRINLSNAKASDIEDTLAGMRQLAEVSELTDENLALEKKIVLAELKSRDTISNRADQSYSALINPQNQRFQVPGIGTVESIGKITLEQVESFKTRFYRPENALIVIAGDVDLKRTKRLISSKFSDWLPSESKGSVSNLTPVEYDADVYDNLPEHSEFRDPKTRTVFRLFEHSSPTQMNDIISDRKRAFVDRLVISMMKTRLKSRIVNDEKVSWILPYKNITADYDITGVNIGALDYQLAVKYFEEERHRVIKYGFNPEEIEYELKKQLEAFTYAADPTDTIDAWSEANTIRSRYVNGNIYNSVQQELEIVKAFKNRLTKADFDEAALRMWTDFKPNYWTKSAKNMNNTVLAAKDTAKSIRAEDIAPIDNSENNTFEKIKFQGSGKVESRDIYKEDTHRLLYENGARLNYKMRKSDNSDITIAVALQPVDSGFLKNYSAISEKTLSFSRADILGMDEFTMNRELVGIKSTLEALFHQDRLVLHMHSSQDDLKDSLAVLATFLDKFDIESDDHERNFAGSLDSLKVEMQNSPLLTGVVKLPLYLTEHSAFQSYSADGYLIASHRDKEIEKIIKSGGIEVGVVGNFDPEILEFEFSKTFGALPPRSLIQENHQYQDPDVKIKPINSKVHTLTYSGSMEQMGVFYCWLSSFDDDPEEAAAKTILINILLNRSVEKIREEEGLTYAPQIFWQENEVFPQFGYTCLGAQIDPKNEEATYKAFEHVVDSFHETQISKSELTRAREPLLSILDRTKKSDQADLLYVATSYSYPEQWEYSINEQKALRKLDLTTIRRLSKIHFKPQDLLVFRIQHYQGTRAIKQNNLLAKSFQGDVEAQFTIGKSKIFSRVDKEKLEGVALLKKAGLNGNLEAPIVLGNYYKRNGELKLAAAQYALVRETKEGAYFLGSIYFYNFQTFPEISDDEIISLLRHSAESGSYQGQYLLAERLKDGTLVQRDEIGAIKWALISNYLKRGNLSIDDKKGIERFLTGMTDKDIMQAEQEAQAWIDSFE